MQTRRLARIVLTLLLAISVSPIVVHSPDTGAPGQVDMNGAHPGTLPPYFAAPHLPARSLMELMFASQN